MFLKNLPLTMHWRKVHKQHQYDVGMLEQTLA